MKHNIGCELALIHTPEVSLPESFLDSVKKRADGSGEDIKTAAEFFGIKLIRQFLCQCHITDIGEGIVVAFIRNTIGIKHMLHQFPAVYVNLDVEGEPCLDLNKHEPEFLAQVIEIIVQTFGKGRLEEMCSFLSNNFSGSAGFQSLQNADKAIVNGV